LEIHYPICVVSKISPATEIETHCAYKHKIALQQLPVEQANSEYTKLAQAIETMPTYVYQGFVCVFVYVCVPCPCARNREQCWKTGVASQHGIYHSLTEHRMLVSTPPHEKHPDRNPQNHHHDRLCHTRGRCLRQCYDRRGRRA
jgi:hypothetical protein